MGECRLSHSCCLPLVAEVGRGRSASRGQGRSLLPMRPRFAPGRVTAVCRCTAFSAAQRFCLFYVLPARLYKKQRQQCWPRRYPIIRVGGSIQRSVAIPRSREPSATQATAQPQSQKECRSRNKRSNQNTESKRSQSQGSVMGACCCGSCMPGTGTPPHLHGDRAAAKLLLPATARTSQRCSRVRACKTPAVGAGAAAVAAAPRRHRRHA